MTGKPSGDEIAEHYLAAYRRLSDLARSLTPEQAATEVPATPGWTVHDVLAHVAAIPTDALAGRLSGIPDDEFTAGQIAERRDRSVGELLDEWGSNAEAMAEGARAGLVPPNLAVDALTHEQDIRGALGFEPVLDKNELRFCVNLYGFGLSIVRKSADLPAVEVRAADTDYSLVAGAGEPAATVTAPEFELFRALSGRRSKGQVSRYDWSGDPTPYLDPFCFFGPLSADDVDG